MVDAGMRQLKARAWMHNRVRMLTASFLVKDLHLDWRRGARHFMRHLVDGDLASNQHGWQWTAGTGTDASPYFRIFNPVTQGKRFDPDGNYVRRWVPELAAVPARFVHEPWRSPDGVPEGYVTPVVDHAVERRRSLEAYEALRRPRR
jgi:deoxyribodipyrimidine photo-lyase